MNRFVIIAVLWLSAGMAAAQDQLTLRGVITDPSGASVPDALVELRAGKMVRQARTGVQGEYTFNGLPPGTYTIRIRAKGFKPVVEEGYVISGPAVLDLQLAIQTEAQVVNVEDETNTVSTDPASNTGAIVLKEKELAALSDDPDELEQQLQAMAGPAAGPNGGQIYIDGFTGGSLPAKSSIREVRINSNPYSPEYDRPGFGRIEIFTKPGTDKIRGMAFLQINDESLNSRSPLLTQSTRPPYAQRFFGFNVSGPIRKQKASYTFDAERRSIDENAFIYATTLDSSLNPLAVNQALLTPQVRTTLSPRLDYTIDPKNTLTLRYQNTRVSSDNEGVGSFSLPSRAYNQTDSENTVQITETAVLSAKAVNETRFQFMRTALAKLGDNTVPALSVQGAFDGGGAQVGNSSTTSNHFELTNLTTYIRNTHTIKWGARVRRSLLEDTSVNNFGGTYTFFGGSGPELDANNQPIAGTSIDLTALERYRRTLLFQAAGYSPDLIRLYGGGASQFSLSAGLPSLSVTQWDAGLFVNDDWRIRPNLTFSYGLRYEAQTNAGDLSNFSPRLGIAWGIGGGAKRQVKTVLRAGFGAFYDRLADTLTLQSIRFNGTTQQSYLIRNPDFFPAIPSLEALQAGQQPQSLQVLDSGLRAPRHYQTSVGVDRQINQYARFSVQYIHSRGVHLQRSRNINAPVDGVYPYGDSELRLLTESTGLSRSHQLVFSPNVNYKKIFLFGFYGLSYGKTNAEGVAADPYNLNAEWGPSSFADIRHRFLLGTNVPLPLKFSVSPFLFASSGVPYTITTGRDTNGDGFTAERPSLLSLAAASCSGGSLVYAPGYGCFNLNPAPGEAIGRNSARGPMTFNVNLRLSRTWSFGSLGESGPAEGGPPPGMGGIRGGGGPPRGGGMMGGPGGPGGRMGGGFGGGSTGKKYNLTLSVAAHNLLNRANYAAPSGDLSSPYFGVSRSLAGFGPMGAASTYNRKVDVQLRFTF